MQRTEIVRQDDKNIIDPFLRHTKSGPTDVAIIDGAEVLTYQELWRLSKYVVHSLWDFGIRKGDRVAYFLPNGVDLIVLYLAIQAMGAVAVPVNYRFTSEEVGCLVNASDAEALIYAPEHQSVAIDARKGFDHAVQILSSQFIRDALSDMRQGGQSDSAKDFEVFQEGGPSRIQFTGGSTGAPKGAARTHAADLVEIRDILETIGLEDVEHPVALVQAPMEHHGGHSWLLSCLSAGAAVVVASKFDAEEILGKIERYAVTHIILLPPSVYCPLTRGRARRSRPVFGAYCAERRRRHDPLHSGGDIPAVSCLRDQLWLGTKRERRRHFDAIVEGGIRFRHAKNPFGGSADEIFRNDVAR